MRATQTVSESAQMLAALASAARPSTWLAAAETPPEPGTILRVLSAAWYDGDRRHGASHRGGGRQVRTGAIHNYDDRSDRYVIPHKDLSPVRAGDRASVGGASGGLFRACGVSLGEGAAGLYG